MTNALQAVGGGSRERQCGKIVVVMAASFAAEALCAWEVTRWRTVPRFAPLGRPGDLCARRTNTEGQAGGPGLLRPSSHPSQGMHGQPDAQHHSSSARV